MKKWLSDFFFGKGEIEGPIQGIEASTKEESLQLGLQAAKEHAQQHNLRIVKSEFYCGLCRGWVPIENFADHNHAE